MGEPRAFCIAIVVLNVQEGSVTTEGLYQQDIYRAWISKVGYYAPYNEAGEDVCEERSEEAVF